MLRCVALAFVVHLAKAHFTSQEQITEHKTDFGSQEQITKHKISMIISPTDSQKPAIFSHGESPVWDPESQSLYFVDVHAQNVHRLDYSTGKIYTKHIGYGEVNIVSLVSGSRRLLVAVRAGLYLLDWDVAGDAALRLLTNVDQGMPDNVLNEGKPDAYGRFWAGTKGPQTGDEVLADRATLYSIDQENFMYPKIQLKPVSISNGIVWSHNNTVMYYNDSPTQKIEALDFDLAKGEIGGRRTILDISQHGYEDAIPDGMTIDSLGNLWVALMFGGTVLHIDPDLRQIIQAYKLPASRTTSLAWGGPNLDELFVTTSRDTINLNAEPLGGVIFTLRNTGYRGVIPHSFSFENADNY